MQFIPTTIRRNVFHSLGDFFNKGFSEMTATEEQPLRAELFGSDQMKLHGRTLAEGHALRPGRLPDQLLSRLAENETVLVEVCRLLTEGDRRQPGDYPGRGMAAR